MKKGRERDKNGKYLRYLNKIRCLYCNKSFVPKNTKRKYCSRKCYWSDMKGKPSGIIYTKDIREKISIALKGKVLTREHRLKLSKATKGRKLSEETKIKMSKIAKEKGFGRWMKGKKLSMFTRKKISNRHRGCNSYNWKGDNASYRAKHSWVSNYYGPAKQCSICGKSGEGQEIHWANKDHKYRRIRQDWFQACVSCHIKYDKDNKLR